MTIQTLLEDIDRLSVLSQDLLRNQNQWLSTAGQATAIKPVMDSAALSTLVTNQLTAYMADNADILARIAQVDWDDPQNRACLTTAHDKVALMAERDEQIRANARKVMDVFYNLDATAGNILDKLGITVVVPGQ